MSLVRDEILDQWVALSLAEYFGVGAPEASVERILRKARGETGERHPAESSGPTLQTAGPHRGLRLAVAAAVVAAAATVAFLLFNPPPEDADKNPVVACQGENPPGNEVEFKDPTEEDTWIEKSTITHDEKSRVDVGPDSATLTRGSVRVKLEAGETYHVEAAGFVFTMHGPGQATVTLTPMRQMIGFMGQQDAGPQRSALAALSEVTSVLLLVRMHKGSAVLAQGEAIEELVAPATAQRMLYVVPDEEPWAEPLTLDELFHELDENGDGKLKPDEVSADFIARLDGNDDGELSTEELAKSDKLKPEYASQIIPFSRQFREMDRNGDGGLDAEEVGEDIVNAGDRDGSGDLNAEEAEAVFTGPVMGGNSGPTHRELFSHLDRNKDGRLDADEVSPSFLKVLDQDGSGDIDLEELRRVSVDRLPPAMTTEQQFALTDSNGDGVLTEGEVPAELIQEADSNGDGEISLDEYAELAKRFTPSGD